MLESYGDESGTDDRSSFASFGGYLAEQGQWKTFSSEWRRVLRELRLRELSPGLEDDFRTGNFYALAKKATWSKARKDECVIRLAQTIKKRTLTGFAALVSTRNYNCAFSEPIRKRRLKDRYYLLFEQALMMQWRLLYYGGFAGRVPAAFFFDEKKGFESRALRIFDGLQRSFDKKQLMVSRKFVSSAAVAPIQAADFIAFELRHYGLQGGHLSPSVTTAMDALKRDLMVHEFKPAELATISKRLEERAVEKRA
ncbi:MAG TPA: DUF3800 domain-containing protein [Candidatus Binataceae bacterium]|nr:DUF3800 domain-containing protein [Candidatus Binataceae bacterium]